MKVIYLFFLLPLLSFNDFPLSEAKLLIAQKKYREAIQLLNTDTSIEANYYRGFCYFQIGNCSASTQALNVFIQSENKYQSESWKNEARSLIAKCQNKSNNSGTTIASNQTKKISRVDQLKTQYQKSFADITNAINQQNRYEDSIKFAESNRQRFDDKKLTSYIIKPNDIAIIANNGNEKNIKETKPVEKIINPTPTKKQDNPQAPPIQEKVANNTIAKPVVTPKSTPKPIEKSDITVTSKNHHYKILFAIGSNPDAEYLSLMDIGPVSSEKANGENYLYYIGFYPTKDAADKALISVKSRGFEVARVMEFNKGTLEKEYKEEKQQVAISQVLDKKTSDEAPAVEKPKAPQPEPPKQSERVKEQIQEVIKSDVISYHILFRVLPNPYEKFDDLKKFGPLYRETFDEKGNSRYLIGNTDNINDAKKLLEKVKKAGYGASMVAEYVNGKLSKIATE